MCGFLYARLATPDNEFKPLFHQALTLMGYRGRDAAGMHQIEEHFFGHVRLSILDLSNRSNQPIISDEHILLFNGEIYNYQQLIPHAISDTLAIDALIKQKTAWMTQLAGMYAVLVYDKKSKDVHVIRDLYGEKPLYYYQDDKITLVSSTIKSIIYLVREYVKKTLMINHLALYDYFICGYIREPKSIYEDIKVLSSGHQLHLSNQGVITVKNNVEEILNHTHQASDDYMVNCIKSADVERGLLLSSGVDSSYILSSMQQSNIRARIMTYKANDNLVDESAMAIENAFKIGKFEAHEIDVIENQFDSTALYEQYPTILEQPSSDGINLFNILLGSRVKNKELKLVFLGTGGDELYGGYHSFKHYKKFSFMRYFSFIRLIFPKRYQRFFITLTKKQAHTAAYYYLYRACPFFLTSVPSVILNKLFQDFLLEMEKYKCDAMNHSLHDIKIYETFDYMRNQLLRDADNISLALGYEARNPFLSVAGYKQKPDYKKGLKHSLEKKHNIQFNKKKGFTFHSQENDLNIFIQRKLKKLNNEYQLLSSNLLTDLLSAPNLALHKKLLMLLSWLKENQVSIGQLQGFHLS